MRNKFAFVWLVCNHEIVTTPAGFLTKDAKIVFYDSSKTNKSEVDHNKT